MKTFRVVFGIFCIAIVACGAASSPASEANGADAAANGPPDGTKATPDGGWLNECSPARPIRWYVYNTDHENPEPLHDTCETLPEQCASDAGLTDPREVDTTSTCDCVVGLKKTKNDAGHSACPGNGPVYCDILEDRSLVIRCSPP